MRFLDAIRNFFHQEPPQQMVPTSLKLGNEVFRRPVVDAFKQRDLERRISQARSEQVFREPANPTEAAVVDIGVRQLTSMGSGNISTLSALMGSGVYQLNSRLRRGAKLDDGRGCTADLDWAGYASYKEVKDHVDILFSGPWLSDSLSAAKLAKTFSGNITVYRGLSFEIPIDRSVSPEQHILKALGVSDHKFLDRGIVFATPNREQASFHPGRNYYLLSHAEATQKVTMIIHAHSFIALPNSDLLPPEVLDLVAVTDHAATDTNVIFRPNSEFEIQKISTLKDHTTIEVKQL